jgi:hypothetical protein
MNCKCGHDHARHSNGYYCKVCPSRCRHFEASGDGLERTLVTPIETGKVFSAPDGKDYILSGDATIVPAEASKVYQKWLADQLEKQRASYEASAHPGWFDKIVGFAFSVVMLLVLIGPVSAAISDSAKLYSPQGSTTIQTVLGIIPLMASVVVLLSIVGMIGIGDKGDK